MLIVVLIVVPAPDDVCVDDALGRCDQVLRSSDDEVLARATYDLDEYVLGALRAGASGLLVDHQTPGVFVDAIRVLADGGGFVSPRPTRLLLRQHAPDPAGDAGGSLLTAHEPEIVRLVTKGHTNDDIAADLSISVPTVTSHSRSIRQKIRGSTRARIVIWAYENNVR